MNINLKLRNCFKTSVTSRRHRHPDRPNLHQGRQGRRDRRRRDRRRLRRDLHRRRRHEAPLRVSRSPERR